MEFRELARINGSYAESRILHTAVALGVFDALDAGGRTAAEIATHLETNPRATELLLNALVAMRLVRKDRERYRETEIARTMLAAASPTSYADMIRFDAALWPLWEHLPEAVRSGTPPRAPDAFQSSPTETARFIQGMDSLVRARGDAGVLAEHLALAGNERLLDVGAGPGTYAIELCRRHPTLRATIADLPGTLAITRGYVTASGFDDRITLVACDYRCDPLPGDHDVVFMSNVIHGEDEATNRQLMQRAAEALVPGGRLLIKDHITDDSGTSPAVAAIFSITMLLFTHGRDYSFPEIRAWLVDAGFSRVEVDALPPGLLSSLVIGYR
jgi:SAM-dependent methyltransferase